MTDLADGTAKRTVLITGASGLIGTALSRCLEARGDRVVPLSRQPDAAAWWDIDAGKIHAPDLAPDAVVHLAGENIGQGRWTPARKQQFVKSRVRSTSLLCEWMAQLPIQPKVLVSASATGIYGDCGEREVDERSPLGEDFLADLCRNWEAATGLAEQAGIRVVHMRTGVVLSPDGGALKTMLPPFRMGLGGRVGNGRQWMSWASLDDAVRAIEFALDAKTLQGAVNLVCPNPTRQADFARSLGKALRRPALLPLPAFAVKMLFGEMGKALLLASTRVAPNALTDSGFEFTDADLDAYLASCCR